MKKSDIFWQTYINLEKDVIEMSKYIFVTDEKTVSRNGQEVVETCSTQLPSRDGSFDVKKLNFDGEIL